MSKISIILRRALFDDLRMPQNDTTNLFVEYYMANPNQINLYNVRADFERLRLSKENSRRFNLRSVMTPSQQRLEFATKEKLSGYSPPKDDIEYSNRMITMAKHLKEYFYIEKK